MKRLIISLLLIGAALSASAQTDTLYLSSMYTTHILFQSDLEYVDISNKALAGKVLESSKNVLAIKARSPFDYSTTVTALEAGGQLHTYIVVYEPSPKALVIDYRTASKETSSTPISGRFQPADAPSFQDVSEGRQRLYHIADRKFRISAVCEDVFVFGDVTYFVISMKNKSGINYECSDAGFVVESRKKTKRSIEYGKTLSARSKYGSLSVDSGGQSRVVYTMDKVTLTDDQVLRIYFYENSGSRNLKLSLTAKDINDARRYR